MLSAANAKAFDSEALEPAIQISECQGNGAVQHWLLCFVALHRRQDLDLLTTEYQHCFALWGFFILFFVSLLMQFFYATRDSDFALRYTWMIGGCDYCHQS
jgi:hypothetical protein